METSSLLVHIDIYPPSPAHWLQNHLNPLCSALSLSLSRSPLCIRPPDTYHCTVLLLLILFCITYASVGFAMSPLTIILTIAMVVGAYFYFKLQPKKPAGAVSRSPPATARPAAGPAEKKKGKVTVLFGSQTGTAEMFAKTVAREGTKMGVPMVICDVEEYDTVNLEDERMVILVCSTYGEGEPTDSMKAFHDWMMDDCRERGEELSNVRYTVFGLGDKQYKYFCEEGIVMDRRFEELGAKRVYGMCCGDCGSGNLEEQFDEWCTNLWPALGRELDIPIKANTEEPVEPECRIKFWDEPAAPLAFPKTASVLEPTQRIPVWVPVARNDELLINCTDRQTHAIDFDISETIISYQAGDHLGILPRNSDDVVDRYLKILDVSSDEAEKVFSLQDKKLSKNVFPARVSVRTALTWYIDLAGQPKKSTLRAFAHCCNDAAQKEDLLRLLRVNPEAQKEYTKLSATLRTVAGFLEKFNSAKVPLSLFLELMPRITPRYFSISSDVLFTPKTVGVTVAHVPGGLCTTMLMNMKPGERVPVFVRKSTFHLPLRAKERPVVMIGPGTGVAPFIGFLQRRRAWMQKNFNLGPAILFFGCRKEAEDHIYKSLCESAVADGLLTAMDVAYSREGPNKVYVQHRLKDRRAEVWDLLQQGGNLYICGDAKHMAKDVEKELLEMAAACGGMTPEAAQEFFKKMEQEERFLKDVWASSA
eukprot:gene8293-5811_t